MAVLRRFAAAAALATLAAFPPAGVALAGDRDCPDFPTQEAAQAALEPGDPERLDGDDDGIACEDNPTSASGEGTAGTGAEGTTGPSGDDNGQAPSGGVEAGYGGTAGNDSEALLPLSVLGGAVLLAGGAATMRRRTARGE